MVYYGTKIILIYYNYNLLNNRNLNGSGFAASALKLKHGYINSALHICDIPRHFVIKPFVGCAGKCCYKLACEIHDLNIDSGNITVQEITDAG